MLRFKTKQADKGAYHELPHNLSLLMELNHGPLWVKLTDGRDALLIGADLNSWMGDGKENIYFVINGTDATLPSTVRMAGYYDRERLDVPIKKGDDVEVGPPTGERIEVQFALKPRHRQVPSL